MFQEGAMRIVAGEWRGRKLIAPDTAAIRPTSDRIKESLFSILNSRFDGDWHTLHVADFCAGSGALGLEALSRGAASCVFVEKDAAAARLIEQNIAALGAAPRATLLRADVLRLPPAKQPVDLILFDPPYAQAIVAEVLGAARTQGWAQDKTVCAVEQPAKAAIDAPGWACIDVRRYGKTQIMLFESAA
jgi:16S rRNA (guanine966-N2)-methyltransferase